MDSFGKLMLNHSLWVVAIIILGLVAVPIAIWLDLRHLSDQNLQVQVTSFDSIISEIRGYYSRNVVGRIQLNSGRNQVLHNYQEIPGAIPIPATLSIELGDLISFRARIGINTGYCNVGNFGSEERKDYTIIGAEANLAARLESIAEPGGIVMSYETFVLVQDMVEAIQLEPAKFKDIAREVIPYAVRSVAQSPKAQRIDVMNERLPGIRLFLDVKAMDDSNIDGAKQMLENALQTVASRKAVSPASS